MSTTPDPGRTASAGKRWRFGVHTGWSVIVYTAVLVAVIGGTRRYDPNRPPDLLDFATTVCTYLLLPAFYGLCAGVILWRRATHAGRGYLVGAAAVGAVTVTLAWWVDSTLSGADCRPSDCVAAVPDPGYFTAAYAVSILPAVVTPLLLAIVRWPRPMEA